MLVGARAAAVAGLIQLEDVKAAWKLSLNFFLYNNYFLLRFLFFPA